MPGWPACPARTEPPRACAPPAGDREWRQRPRPGRKVAWRGRRKPMIVYGSSMSPYVRKVLMFAAEKDIEVELKALGLQAEDPEFREASPFGLMPGFRDGDFTISDSSA